MPDRIFGDREKAIEEAYFRQEDARLLDKLRNKADLDDIAVALGEKLQIDDPALLQEVRGLSVTLDTAPALFLAPLVQVAWAEGKVSKAEHGTVLRLARQRGVEPGSPAYAQLEEWLRERPSDALFDTAVRVLKFAFDVLSLTEREERIKAIVQACHEVAEASGGLGRLIGLGDGVSSVEDSLLDTINQRLRTDRGSAAKP
jgi:hypothetical protein